MNNTMKYEQFIKIEPITESIIQGSQEWLDERQKYLTSSDAKFLYSTPKKYNEFLKRKRGKTVEEIKCPQDILEKGHETESLFRKKMAKSKIFITPIVCKRGDFMSSLDGMYMEGNKKVVIEHKLYNQELAEYVELLGKIPSRDYWQCVFHLLVSGASRLDYCMSDLTSEKAKVIKCSITPEDVAYDMIDLYSKACLAVERIKDKEFEGVLENFSLPIEYKINKELQVSSNFENVKEKLHEMINIYQGSDLTTDEGQEAVVKMPNFLTKFEKLVDTAINEIVSKNHSIGDAVRALKGLKTTSRDLRLSVSKDLKSRKDTYKGLLIAKCKEGLKVRSEILGEEKDYIEKILGNYLFRELDERLEKAIKGKSNKESMELSLFKAREAFEREVHEIWEKLSEIYIHIYGYMRDYKDTKGRDVYFTYLFGKHGISKVLKLSEEEVLSDLKAYDEEILARGKELKEREEVLTEGKGEEVFRSKIHKWTEVFHYPEDSEKLKKVMGNFKEDKVKLKITIEVVTS